MFTKTDYRKALWALRKKDLHILWCAFKGEVPLIPKSVCLATLLSTLLVSFLDDGLLLYTCIGILGSFIVTLAIIIWSEFLLLKRNPDYLKGMYGISFYERPVSNDDYD